MADGMRLRTAAERRTPARFGDSEESRATVNYTDYRVPELENLNSDFPHPVYQFDKQLARKCAFPTLPFNHPGPGPSGAILQERRKNREATSVPQGEYAVAAGTDNDRHHVEEIEEIEENEAEPQVLEETRQKASIQPIKRGQTTLTGKPNPAIRNHGNQGLPAYETPVEDWIAAVNQQHEARHPKDLATLSSMSTELDPKYPTFGLHPRDRRIDNGGHWTRNSSEFHLSISPSPPGSPSPPSQMDPFAMMPKASSSAMSEARASQPRRPYTVHIDRDAAKRKSSELDRNKDRDFELRRISRKTPDWASLSDGVKYIITYELTKTGMSFVQAIHTFRLTLSEAGVLMNMIGDEQQKIDKFNEEVNKHLHTADVTWIDEYTQTHDPLVTDHITAKEIREGKQFLKFMGFDNIASKLDEYVGVGAGRRFPILLNHFWGDGFKDLPPHFKAFCSEELERMVSTWRKAQRERPPPMSTAEMHVRLDPPPGTTSLRRLLNSLDSVPSTQNNLARKHPTEGPRVGAVSSGNASAPISAAPRGNERHPNGLPNHDIGHPVRQAPHGLPIQHGLPLFLPDPGYGVPINPFASLPPPSTPSNPAHYQHGPWQGYVPVQGPAHISHWPQSQEWFHDRGMRWTGPPPRYREPPNIHFAVATGKDDLPMQPPPITSRPYHPDAHYEPPQQVGMAQLRPYGPFNLSHVFGHGTYRAPVSNRRETSPGAGLQPPLRHSKPLGRYPQQAVNPGPVGHGSSALDPRRSMGAQGAPSQIGVPPMMHTVPQRPINPTTRSHSDPGREQPIQNMAGTSRQTVPLLSAAQLALLYETYDQPHPAGRVARSVVVGQAAHSHPNHPSPTSMTQSDLPQPAQTSNDKHEDVQMPGTQSEKIVSAGPPLDQSREIQQRDPNLRKEVDQWINKYRDSWVSETEEESSSEEEEEEIPPYVPARSSRSARSTRAQRFQDGDDSDEDFVLPNDGNSQEKKKDKNARVSLPVASRRRAASTASTSSGVMNRPRGPQKKSVGTVAPAGTAKKRKVSQTGESQNALKKRRMNGEASSSRAISTTSSNRRRKSAPAAGGVSEEEEYDESKSKPVRGRRQPGGLWGNADTLFTNGRGGFLKRSEVVALPNTKYRPGGSFGGGKWLEEDTGVLWLPVNPSEQCRKKPAEKETRSGAPAADVVDGGEKKPKKSTKAPQVVKNTIRLVSQQVTPSPTKAGSSQATQSSSTVPSSTPVSAPEAQSFEELLSSRGLSTRDMFETDELFRQYVTQLGPPFSTHLDAPTRAPAPRGKSLDNYIPPQARADHEAYLAGQKERTDSEKSQSKDGDTQEQVNEGIQEAVEETARETTMQISEAKEAEKNDLPELLKKQGLDLNAPPVLDTTEQLQRYSTRLRNAVSEALSGRVSSFRSVSPAKETPSRPATKKPAVKGPDTKKTTTKVITAEKHAADDSATEERPSQSPSNFDGGAMAIRTLRPRKGKVIDRGTTPAEALEKR